MKNSKKEFQPSRFWVAMPRFFAWPIFKLKYNIHVDKEQIKGLKAPYIIICNHGARIDPVYVMCSMYPQLITFVGSYGFFKNWFLRWYFGKLKAIPKFQYQTDLKAMKSMIKVVKEGGVLSLHPAGRLPSCGRGFDIPDGLAKLIKLANVPVVSCILNGTYLTKPKWRPSKTKGRVDINYSLLLTKDQVSTMSIEELSKVCNEALAFNDYEWNRDKQIKFGKKNLAVGLESTLYRCPNCGKEFNMSTIGNFIKCNECGFELELQPTGFFKENKFFDHPDQWFEGQRKALVEQINSIELIIEDECDVQITKADEDYNKLGNGKVSLYHDYLVFNGTIDGEVVEQQISIIDMFSLPYKANENFEIADGQFIYKFILKNGIHAAKYCQLVEELYKIRNNLH